MVNYSVYYEISNIKFIKEVKDMTEAKALLLNSLDEFIYSATNEQLNAIRKRDFLLASQLGVSLDQYLYYIDPTYRWKISSRLV
jgi:hypothetical protein